MTPQDLPHHVDHGGGRPRWRAVHLFCHAGREATDRVILDVVAPLVETLRDQGLLDQWFFIRYWQGGPHVRLRVAAHDSPRADRALAILLDQLPDAMAQIPRADPPLRPDDWYRQFAITADEASTYGWSQDGEVRACPYEPEHDRYGGAEVLPWSEELFGVSSELAIVLLRRAPGQEDTQARTGIALDLLIGFVSEIHEHTGTAIRWLREYATMWRYLDAVVGRRHAHIEVAAEATFAASNSRLIARRQALREDGPALYRAWWDAVGLLTKQLRAHDDEAPLASGPDAVLASQLHMLFNRLGFTASDEVYLAWLASLVLAAPAPIPDYFADTTKAADRAYHELSKFRPATMPQQRPRAAAYPGPIRRELAFAGDVPRTLPSPDRSALCVPLADIQARRRSVRGRLDGELDLTTLATLLGAGVGVVGAQPGSPAVGGETRGVRAVPSAGMAYPVFVRVLARKVRGLEPAMYEYLPAEHAIQHVGAPAEPAQLRELSPFFSGEQPKVDIADVPVVLCLAADLGQHRERYGLRSYRFSMLEIGHVAQSLLTVATALGLASVPVGGFFDDAVANLLQLDGYDEVPGYLIPLGTQQPLDPFRNENPMTVEA